MEKVKKVAEQEKKRNQQMTRGSFKRPKIKKLTYRDKRPVHIKTCISATYCWRDSEDRRRSRDWLYSGIRQFIPYHGKYHDESEIVRFMEEKKGVCPFDMLTRAQLEQVISISNKF